MKIKDIGGEFALIDRITKKVGGKDIVRGVGDDAAVIKVGKKYLVYTVDALVEDDHFSLKWFSAKQIGMKAIEINVSDIGAMGGNAKYALVSLVLKRDTDVEFVDRLYEGIYSSCRKHNIKLIGGNITHGKQIMIDVAVIGEVNKKEMCLRSQAKPGDFIFVSGDLGASKAGLNLFLKNKINSGNKGYFRKIIEAHIQPKSKFHKVKKFLKYINAMIDVSDGLASEVTRICEQSKVGAVIYTDNIPIREGTRKAASLLNENALDYALYGGEDFELVYTAAEKNLNKVKGFLVGEITKKKGVRLYSRGKECLLRSHGYDHFR